MILLFHFTLNLLSCIFVESSAFMQPSLFHLQNRNSPILQNQAQPRTSSYSAVVVAFKATSSSNDKGNKKRATLQGIVNKITKTDSVPLPSSDGNTNSLNQFLRDKKTIDVLLGGSKKHKVEPVSDNVLSENMDQWLTKSKAVEAEEPSISNGDRMYTVRTAEMNFPGLKVSSNALIGTTVTPTDELQFVLVKTEQIPDGPAPLVWLFNKMTGNDKAKSGGGDSKQAIRSLSRLNLKSSSEGGTGIFSLATMLELSVEFPSLLLKLMPVSKEKAEEQFSSSIRNTVEKDQSVVVPMFRQLYLDWLEKK